MFVEVCQEQCTIPKSEEICRNNGEVDVNLWRWKAHFMICCAFEKQLGYFFMNPR